MCRRTSAVLSSVKNSVSVVFLLLFFSNKKARVFQHVKIMKQIAVLVFALFGCAYSLPTPEDACDCGNVIHLKFWEKLKIYDMMAQFEAKTIS